MKYVMPVLLLVSPFVVGCHSEGADAPSADAEFIGQMARQTGGDASKLTPAERNRMDTLTKGETDSVLKLTASSTLPPAPPRK